MKFSIFLSANKKFNLLSWAIMKVLGTNYSHCGIIVDDGVTKMVWDATKHNFCETDLSDFEKERVIIHEVDVTHLVFNPMFAHGWLHGNKGKFYGYLSYLGIVFKQLAATVYDGRTSGVCSEAVAWFVYDCTVDGYFQNKRMDTVTPLDIEMFLKQVR